MAKKTPIVTNIVKAANQQQKLIDAIRRDQALGQSLARAATQLDAFSASMRPAGLAASAFHGDMTRALTASGELSRLAEDLNSKFVLPGNLLNELLGQTSQIAEAIKRFAPQQEALAATLSQIKMPWLDANNAMAALANVSTLHAITRMLAAEPPFSQIVVHGLRDVLGDWRGTDPPDHTEDDADARSAFYHDVGLVSDLADFPDPVFDELLFGAGLVQPILDALDAVNDAEAQAFARSQRAYFIISRLERRLRDFVTAIMTKAWGQRWQKQRVPGALRARWDERHSADRSPGKGSDLFDYADLNDCATIIVQNDNWPHFDGYFGRREDVQEMFRRLTPVRNPIMHARFISNEDELLYLPEVYRLLRALGRI